MKSQDILLLLKLVSLWQQQDGDLLSRNVEWQDWDDQSDPRLVPAPLLRRPDESLLTGEGAAVLADQEDRRADPLRGAEHALSPAAESFTLDYAEIEISMSSINHTANWANIQFSVRALAESTGVSKSQISLALQRCYDTGMATIDRRTNAPRANVKVLGEFIIYGIRYVFPAKPGEITRGIATGLAAPVLQGKIMTAGEFVPVWPDARGNTKGQAVEPLFKSVPEAVRKDPQLYALLALTDAIRFGQARERGYAVDKLITLLK